MCKLLISLALPTSIYLNYTKSDSYRFILAGLHVHYQIYPHCIPILFQQKEIAFVSASKSFPSPVLKQLVAKL